MSSGVIALRRFGPVQRERRDAGVRLVDHRAHPGEPTRGARTAPHPPMIPCMEGSVETRSWLRCYRCWSTDLEVQVHYEGIHKIDPDSGEARRGRRRAAGGRRPVPGLHARPAAPGLPRRPRRADRGSLGADDRRDALGRLVHGHGGRRRRRELLGARGRRRPVLRGLRRPRQRASSSPTCASTSTTTTTASSSTCWSSSTRAQPTRRPTCSRTRHAAAWRSRRWPRSRGHRPATGDDPH